VAHTLAVAEEEAQFEHRDLHWGNVLVKETAAKQVSFRLAGDVYRDGILERHF
jgi:serine/threonine-protein kinase haspin